MLNRYLDALTSYADTVVGDLSDHSDNGDILGGTERSKRYHILPVSFPRLLQFIRVSGSKSHTIIYRT